MVCFQALRSLKPLIGHFLRILRVFISNHKIVVKFENILQVNIFEEMRRNDGKNEGIGESIYKSIIHPDSLHLNDVVSTE